MDFPEERLPNLHANWGGLLEGIDNLRVDAATVLNDGDVRAVTVGQLNRRTSKVVQSVRDGERLIVTRHKDPQAVVLSMRDAMELVAGPRILEAAIAASGDLAAGEVVEPWPRVSTGRIVCARAAAERLERVAAQDRYRLRVLLTRGEVDFERPLWLPSGRRLAPVSEPEPDLFLVHDLIDVRELERELIGEEIWSARLVRDLDRLIHARSPWHRRARNDERELEREGG